MGRLLAVLLLAGTSVYAQTITTQNFGSGANAFSIDFVEIGNPSNTADDTGFGSVAYSYNLGKYEISRDQIEKANASGGLGITLYDMTSHGGNGANRPASGISWNEAARFVNWLNSSKGYQAAYNFTTTGPTDDITLWEAGQYSGTNRYRHKDAYYFLPSLNEWYKGAYYDPDKSWNGGYWNYPTKSDIPPSPAGAGTTPNTAIYARGLEPGPEDITLAGGLSAYGTMAQGGNVIEWTESARDGLNDSAGERRELRGGGWANGDDWLSEQGPFGGRGNNPDWGLTPSTETNYEYGFRVAMIPEPSSLSLLLAGGAVLMAGRRRKS